MDEHDDGNSSGEFRLHVSDMRGDARTLRALLAGLARRRRVLGGVIAIVLLLATSLVILNTTPGAQESLARTVGIKTPTPRPSPTPTATLGLSDMMVVLLGGAPWGTVIIDGKQQPAGFLARGQRYSMLTLARGKHTLEVRQNPFPAIQCVISVPAAKDDTCPSAVKQLADPDILPYTRQLDLGARLDQLSEEVYSALLATVNEYSSDVIADADLSMATIEPGEHYLNSAGKVVVAQERLTATLMPSVPSPQDLVYRPLNSDAASCRGPLCDDAGTASYEDGWTAWGVFVQIPWSWHITRADHSTVVDAAPLVPAGSSYDSVRGSQATALEVRLTWDGHWHVQPLPDYASQPLDGTTWYLTMDLGAQVGMAALASISNPQKLSVAVTMYNDANLADGSLLVMGPPEVVDSGVEDTTKLPQFLYRFGTLLAANDLAHKLIPSLPVVSASERALLQTFTPPHD